MATWKCWACGHELSTDIRTCPECGRPPAPPGFPPYEPVPPELLEQARREVNEEEYIAALREYEEKGGLTFEDLMRGLEEAEPGTDERLHP